MTSPTERCAFKEMVDVGRLRPHPKNRNVHSTEQVERLAKIIGFQGFRHPIIVSNLSGFIVAGHGRLDAAKKLGLKQVPVDYQDFPDEEAEYAFLVADNAIASWAELDLSGINGDIGELGPDFDIDLLGIKDFVIEPADKQGEGDPDEVPEPARPVVKRGELYILGAHRLMCGDSTCQEDVGALMDGEKAEIVFTDPPYNVDYDYNFHTDKKPLLEYLNWTREWVARAGEIVTDDAWFFTKNAPRNLMDYQPLVREQGWDFRNLIVWVHPPHLFPPGRFYDNWEAIVAFSKGKPVFNSHAETRTVERPISEGGGTHDKGRIGDVWDGIKYVSAGAMKSKEAVIKEGTNSKSHPCQMPEALPLRALNFASKANAICYEPFCGSGTTLLAAERANRRCFGMEIDPVYCGVILDRWAKFTGKDPIREGGTPWSTIKANEQTETENRS